MINQSLPVLILGLILGIKHAFDADHILAVSTLATKHNNPFKAALIGAFWGLGHTITLLLTGFLILFFKIAIPPKISLTMELLVGGMLIVLGMATILNKKITYHNHKHKHDDKNHAHIHDEDNKLHDHIHKKSFLVGVIHGLAGSGGLMLLVLSTINSVTVGLYYILIFGIGSTGAMTSMSLLLSLPYLLAFQKFPNLFQYINKIAGMLSVIFGLVLIYEIIMLGKLIF